MRIVNSPKLTKVVAAEPSAAPIPPWLAPAVVTRFKKLTDPDGDAVIDRLATAMEIARNAATKARAGHLAIMGDPLQTELANMKRSRDNTFRVVAPALKAFDSSLKEAHDAIKDLEAAMTPKAPPIASEIRALWRG